MLVDCPDEAVFVQRNDCVPPFPFSNLEQCSYEYETLELEREVVAVSWDRSVG
ncbi:hypothetical protein [Natrarchaeobaculum sulfurireducens]|uniref:Uncharacterized protein n=1 Tax=Natrarchaeobaculum sulfurireducens TaxID=2044521 RepID=A0A346PF48_9EURY|nr:hypothetical protein [Natrarchaeobaculum sulfurireducens]AXR78143.1 hypothetical protein AArc1_1819 [Natrarchaeobaculum sulfurireducens]AXR81868.1 hypothetical protein AArcMg_1861 [Natrarchaeobaculum sulfurireducens]